MGKIIVFSITGCRHCKAAKKLLNDLNAPFTEINLDDHPAYRDEMVRRAKRKTVPQIFFNSQHVGGNSELQQLHEDEKLEPFIIKTLEEDAPDIIQPPQPKDLDADIEDEQDSKRLEEKHPEVTKSDRWKELLEIVNAMTSGDNQLEIKDRRYRFWVYKKCFLGSESVDWIMKYNSCSREEAINVMKEMYDVHLIHHVNSSEPFHDGYFFYRFQSDEKHTALNLTHIFQGSAREPNIVGSEIRRMILRMYGKYLSEDGDSVDYEGLSKSKEFEGFCLATEELQKADVTSMGQNEKLAFWINLYNALVIHGRIVNGAPSSTMGILRSFSSTKYNVGQNDYSLNDIENGVLRGNKKAPNGLTRPFSKTDPRRFAMLTKRDPRIHFALVCGAKSCPPIKLYSAENVDEELTLAAESFLEDECIIHYNDRDSTPIAGCAYVASDGEIELSKILKWYQDDFGSSEVDLLSWIHSFLSSERQKQMESVIVEGNYKIKYMHYDWGLNSH